MQPQKKLAICMIICYNEINNRERNKDVSTYLLYAYLIIGILAFFAYGVDKRKAKRKRRRISESVLLGLGFFGGAIGALLGMHLFRHKTRHWYFWTVNLLGLIWQVALFLLLRKNGF